MFMSFTYFIYSISFTSRFFIKSPTLFKFRFTSFMVCTFSFLPFLNFTISICYKPLINVMNHISKFLNKNITILSEQRMININLFINNYISYFTCTISFTSNFIYKILTNIRCKFITNMIRFSICNIHIVI